jgi:adenylyltransferase/sulfurtransferase
LARADLLRYSRQMLLPEVGGAGQRRLAEARVAVVGLGGLGSPVALYLAAAGVGTLGLIDPDRVELSNLQRQVLHGTADLGGPKTDSGRRRLLDLNPAVRVVPHAVRVDGANAAALLAEYDVVVEGSDDLATKLVVNDACVALRRPLVVAAVAGWDGQLMVVRPGGSPCYRCVCRSPAAAEAGPTCATAGILGPVAGVMGSLQAVETLKVLLARPAGPERGFLFYDARTGEVTSAGVHPDPSCPACGRDGHPTERA